MKVQLLCHYLYKHYLRFLVDECTGTKVASWLREQGYEVFSVYEEVRGISDNAIITKAFNENWILITNDRDFGEKVYREQMSHRGIILLRLQDERSTNKIDVLQRLFSMYQRANTRSLCCSYRDSGSFS